MKYLPILICLLLFACGSGQKDVQEETTVEAPAAQAVEKASPAEVAYAPCELLTEALVLEVFPGATGVQTTEKQAVGVKMCEGSAVVKGVTYTFQFGIQEGALKRKDLAAVVDQRRRLAEASADVAAPEEVEGDENMYERSGLGGETAYQQGTALWETRVAEANGNDNIKEHSTALMNAILTSLEEK